MYDANGLDRVRRFYAALVVRQAHIRAPRIEAAFASIARERFLGLGPWWIGVGDESQDYLATPDAEPIWLYQDFAFVLDRELRIHNGLPRLHARNLARLNIRPGESIVHIGAGSGYYTAIMAELTGQSGSVNAYEINPDLAARAKASFSGCGPNIILHEADGATGKLPPADVIYVNASSTKPVRSWINALRPGGRLLFPLAPTNGGGTMLLIRRSVSGDFQAQAGLAVSFIPAKGLQDPTESSALTEAFARGWPRAVQSLHLDTEPEPDVCWVSGSGWWLSTAPIAASVSGQLPLES